MDSDFGLRRGGWLARTIRRKLLRSVGPEQVARITLVTSVDPTDAHNLNHKVGHYFFIERYLDDLALVGGGQTQGSNSAM
jgi:hypothetical protein